MTSSVSVLGCGHMGSALLKGLASSEEFETIGYDITEDTIARIEKFCTRTTTDITEASTADIVVIAVKPDTVPAVLSELSLSSEQTLVTIAAGVTRDFVMSRTNANAVRVMPNLAGQLNEMAAAVSWDHENPTISAMLDELGNYVVIDEAQMDVATALNGSGPAFVYYLIDAMRQQAVEEGLNDTAAKALSIQTFIGAAEMVRAAEKSIDELIDAVCSPNGTTIEGMSVLFSSSVEQQVGEALTAATDRSREISAEVSND